MGDRLGVAILLIKIMAESYRSTGRIFGGDIVTIMFRPDHLFDCLLTDALLFFGNTLWCVPLQKAVLKGTFSWDVSGWILQAVWELVFLYLVISYTLYKEWPWIQTVFLVLHGLVILMKMHSYAFYNGYLSEVYKRRKALEEKLAQIKDAVASESTGTAESTGTELLQVEASLIYNRSRRRSSVGQLDISHLPTELSPRQLKQFSALVAAEIEACDAELSLEAANSPKATYPENLTYYNYLEYLHFPTVVYELNYPRSLSINWAYVAEKTAATFGVLGIMVVISQHFIYPVVMVANALHTLPVRDRLFEFPWILLKLVFPFMVSTLFPPPPQALTSIARIPRRLVPNLGANSQPPRRAHALL